MLYNNVILYLTVAEPLYLDQICVDGLLRSSALDQTPNSRTGANEDHKMRSVTAVPPAGH